MKKLSLFLVVIALCFSSTVYAAGTITGSSELIDENTMRVTYTVTFGADATSFADVALDSITATTGARLRKVGGWWLLRIDYNYGATGPTDNSDLYLWLVTDKSDILGNNGLNVIDNATNNTLYPATVSQPLSGAELIDIDNNAVNDATCTLIFTLYK